MRILVTNDDGVESPGIKTLAAMLAADGHEVTVFAPTSDRSGAGAGIGKLYGDIPPPVTRADWPDVPGVAVHALDAPPATAVLAACMGAFGDPPELVASGRSEPIGATGAADAVELTRVWERILPEQAAARRQRTGEPSVRPLDTGTASSDTRRSAMT
jgi:hypothetical protein